MSWEELFCVSRSIENNDSPSPEGPARKGGDEWQKTKEPLKGVGSLFLTLMNPGDDERSRILTEQTIKIHSVNRAIAFDY